MAPATVPPQGVATTNRTGVAGGPAGNLGAVLLTEIDQSPEGDTFFPAFAPEHWQEISRQAHDGFAFVTYQRKR